jgi:ABC-type lipoprotein export system ATPase subunit
VRRIVTNFNSCNNAALDPKNADLVFIFLDKLVKERGITILMITHDHERVKVKDRGKILRIEDL